VRSSFQGTKTKSVVQEQDSDVQEIEIETVADSESQVVIISETQNRRDITGKAEAEPDVIPYIKGIKLMSAREADECARHGEVIAKTEGMNKIEAIFY
jgi:hypothetical protein